MGEDKLLIEYRGKTLLQRAVDLLAGLPTYEKILVTTAERLETILLPRGIRAEVNANPGEGLSGSIRLGLEAASGEWYYFMTADQPGLSVEDLLPLLEYAGHDSDKYKIVYPVINGAPSTPSLFSSCFRAELLALSGDTGGRAVREAHPEACVEVAPERPAHFSDIDNKEDLTAVGS